MEKTNDLFENTGIIKTIAAVALPSVAGQVILVLYNMADTLFIGMTGSDACITAVTVCMPAFMFLSAIANLFGVGGASAIARARGAGDTRKAADIAAFCVWGCLTVAAVYCGGVAACCDNFVSLLGGGNTAVHGEAVTYMLCAVALGGTATALATLFSHLIRACGYSLPAGIGVAVGGVLNIVLDPLFMFVLLPRGQEVLGAALATAVSNVAALLYDLLFIAARRDRMAFGMAPGKAMFRDAIPRDVLRVGLAACLMTVCENVSYAVLDRCMAAVGMAAQAGVGVAKKVNMLAHSTVRGMTQGVMPVIGYNYAAGNRVRMKKILYISGGIAGGIALSCTVVCLRWSRPLIALFIHTDGASLTLGAAFLRTLCLGAPFSALAYTVISFFEATGRGYRSLILALLRKGVIDIPFMFLLGHLLPVYGIVWATPLADVLCSITALWMLVLFIRRHGKNKAPVSRPRC